MLGSRNALDLCVSRAATIRQAAQKMDAHHLGIVFVVDSRRRLLGTVTDGDLRRAMLARTPLDRPVRTLLERKKGTPFAKPLSAPVNASAKKCLALLTERNLLHLPLVDRTGRVKGLVTLEELVGPRDLPVRAIVMAGGKGTRLFPLTKDTPKPMLNVGDRPLMERILEQLRDVGIRKVKVSTHHKKEKITEHFGDGKRMGLDLSYLFEEQPLGTAGALGILGPVKETTLVINGDVLTQVNFRAMLDYHREAKAELTTAVSQYDFKVPYGVVETKGPMVTRIIEKPTYEFFVGAGVYLVEPSAARLVPKGHHFDMTDLITRLLKAGRRVASFPIREYWLDIGLPADYDKAQVQAATWKKEGKP